MAKEEPPISLVYGTQLTIKHTCRMSNMWNTKKNNNTSDQRDKILGL